MFVLKIKKAIFFRQLKNRNLVIKTLESNINNFFNPKIVKEGYASKK